MMNNKECIEDLKNGNLYDEDGVVNEHGYAVLLHAEAHHEIFREDWIPIKTRPLTEEEKQNAIEKHDIEPYDLEYPFAWHFDCELPKLKEDEQSVDVLVTTDLGFVKVTNFFINYIGCPCFEEMDEAGEFVAWMLFLKDINRRLTMSKRLSKRECEEIFVKELRAAGFKWYAVTYERGNYYWCFQLESCQRYWTNLSKDSCRKLGISDADGVERLKKSEVQDVNN